MSTVTILSTTSSEPLTKTITQKVKVDGSIEYSIRGYSFGVKEFSSRQRSVSNFGDLVDLLTELKTEKNSCIVRGCVKDQIDKTKHTRTKAAIEDVDQQWICLDIDEFPSVSFGIDDAPVNIKQYLPKCFADASCFWSFSSSQGYKKGGNNTASIHYWFWLDDVASNVELKAYFSHYNKIIELDLGHAKMVDLVLFDSIQIHYTAAPLFIGVADVLVNRFGIIKGTTDTVKLVQDWATIGTEEGAVKHLARIGDDKDGFHDPLLSGSAAWVRLNGDKRHDEFKMLARDIITLADKSRHTDEQIKRYMSDYFLDNLLKSAANKFSDPIGITPETRTEFHNYIYITAADRFLDKGADTYIGKGAFNLVLRKYTHMANNDKLFVDAGGDCVHHCMTLPNEPPHSIVIVDKKKIYNRWEGRHGVLLESYNADPFIEHVNYLCEGREDEAKVLLDYMAHIIANPGIKVHWSPIIGSKVQGTGKSILKIPLRAIFGNNNSAEIGTEDIRRDFNHYMEKEIVFVEEVYGPDQRYLMNRIKSMITEHHVMINIKNMPTYEAPNYANIIMFTNHKTPLLVDSADRRLFFVYSEAEKKEFNYYRDLVEWLNKSRDHVYSWALGRDLTNFNCGHAPPTTKIKEEAVEESVPSWISHLKDAQDQCVWPLQHDLIYAHELIYALKQMTGFNFSGVKIANAVKEFGFVKHSIRPFVGGTRPVVWVIRDKNKYVNLSGTELAEEMKDKAIGDQREWMTSRKF